MRDLICFIYHYNKYFPLSSAVTLGFIKTQVTVNEGVALQDVCFRVLQGTLNKSIIVTVTTRDGEAKCEPVMIFDKLLFIDTLFPQLQVIILVGQDPST